RRAERAQRSFRRWPRRRFPQPEGLYALHAAANQAERPTCSLRGALCQRPDSRNSANCLLQEKSEGRVFIDPGTMQITHMELTTPHHAIIPDSNYASQVVGERVISVDYAPVVLDGQTFWMPATITSRATSAKGTYHAIAWSFKATYRNLPKLEVTSR